MQEITLEELERAAPDILRLKDGELTLIDGSPASEYLRHWGDRAGSSIAVNIVERGLFIRLISQASQFKMAFCSFCGRSSRQVRHLINLEERAVAICDECVEISRVAIAEASGRERPLVQITRD